MQVSSFSCHSQTIFSIGMSCVKSLVKCQRWLHVQTTFSTINTHTSTSTLTSNSKQKHSYIYIYQMFSHPSMFTNRYIYTCYIDIHTVRVWNVNFMTVTHRVCDDALKMFVRTPTYLYRILHEILSSQGQSIVWYWSVK